MDLYTYNVMNTRVVTELTVFLSWSITQNVFSHIWSEFVIVSYENYILPFSV